MTSPTAADFAAARFAEHPDGKIAMRDEEGAHSPWTVSFGGAATDAEMAEKGWRIVTPALDPSDPDVIEQSARKAYGTHNSKLGVEWYREDERVQESWRTIARAALSALTPPPARDPEAEKLESLIDEWKGLGGQRPTLPDFLASRGVRVGGGEDA